MLSIPATTKAANGCDKRVRTSPGFTAKARRWLSTRNSIRRASIMVLTECIPWSRMGSGGHQERCRIIGGWGAKSREGELLDRTTSRICQVAVMILARNLLAEHRWILRSQSDFCPSKYGANNGRYWTRTIPKSIGKMTNVMVEGSKSGPSSIRPLPS